jgi:hypothetical protein
VTTTAAPGTPARPAGRPAPAPAAPPAAATVAAQGGTRPSGFRPAVVLAVLLTGPAVYLVAKGELSPHDALVRFGCAWAFATGGVALVLSTVGGGYAGVDGTSADPAAPSAGASGAADAAHDAAHDTANDPAYDTTPDPSQAGPARVDDAAGTPAG